MLDVAALRGGQGDSKLKLAAIKLVEYVFNIFNKLGTQQCRQYYSPDLPAFLETPTRPRFSSLFQLMVARSIFWNPQPISMNHLLKAQFHHKKPLRMPRKSQPHSIYGYGQALVSWIICYMLGPSMQAGVCVLEVKGIY